MITQWILAGIALGGGETERPLDVVELVGGKQVEGIVLYESSEKVVLKVRSRSQEFPGADVVRVDSLTRNLAQVLDQQIRTNWSRTDEVMALASFCRAKGMEGFARVFAMRALENDPEFELGHEFLGHVRRGDSWRVRRDGRSIAFDKLAEERADWGDEWELETPHYELRTNLDLGQAVDIACDLEHFYRKFYSFLGWHMELYEVTQRMPVNIHGDSVSYPEMLGNRTAYFRPGDFTLIVNAEGGLDMDVVFHEAAHQLVYMTSVRERNGKGRVPGWLDEGLAEIFGSGATGSSGRMGVDTTAREDSYFATQRSAGAPYNLSRVLTMDSSDFHGSTNLELKYAQCYTLTHFLLHGEKEKYRPGFFRFMESAYNGRASSSHFEKAMGIEREELEPAWLDYVRRAGR